MDHLQYSIRSEQVLRARAKVFQARSLEGWELSWLEVFSARRYFVAYVLQLGGLLPIDHWERSLEYLATVSHQQDMPDSRQNCQSTYSFELRTGSDLELVACRRRADIAITFANRSASLEGLAASF